MRLSDIQETMYLVSHSTYSDGFVYIEYLSDTNGTFEIKQTSSESSLLSKEDLIFFLKDRVYQFLGWNLDNIVILPIQITTKDLAIKFPKDFQ